MSFWARTLQPEACAIVSLAVYGAAMPFIAQLNDSAYPGGAALAQPLIRPLVETTSSTIFLVGMLVAAAASGLLYLIHKMAPASRAGNHVAAGLIGGVGGALLVATQASFAPQDFSMYPYIVLFAMVLVLKRFGLWCIIAGSRAAGRRANRAGGLAMAESDAVHAGTAYRQPLAGTHAIAARHCLHAIWSQPLPPGVKAVAGHYLIAWPLEICRRYSPSNAAKPSACAHRLAI